MTEDMELLVSLMERREVILLKKQRKKMKEKAILQKTRTYIWRAKRKKKTIVLVLKNSKLNRPPVKITRSTRTHQGYRN
jgi:hypothetical protein